MVFLDKNSEKTVINRHFEVNCNSLQLINNWSGEVFTFGDLIDLSKSSFFYEFALDLSKLSDGEYTIKLIDEGGNIIETMIGVCGDYEKERKKYQPTNNTRKVYERG